MFIVQNTPVLFNKQNMVHCTKAKVLHVSWTVLATLFNQAKVAVWIAVMPFLREADMKHIVQIGSLLTKRYLPLCN